MSKINVYERLENAEVSPAWNRVSAYVILKGARYAGKILCKHPVDGMGPLEIFLWDWSSDDAAPPPIQYARVTGCGYDKLAAGLEGMKFAGVTFKDHPTDWKTQLREAGFELLSVI